MPLITTNATFTLDGSTDFTVGGQTISWDNGFIEGLDIFSLNGGSHTVTATLSGADWSMGRFSIGGSSSPATTVKAIINDAATGTGRFIDLLNLFGRGGNEVTLLTTQIASINGSGAADSITSSTEWVGSIQLFEGNDSVTINDGSIDSVNLGQGNNTFVSTGGRVSSVTAYDGNDTLNTTGGGGADMINLGSGINSIATGAGFASAIITYDGNDTAQIGSGGVDMLHLGQGNNIVATSTGFVESIVTLGGADRVTIGAGGAGSIRLGQSNDVVTLNGNADMVDGGAGNDTYNLGSRRPVIRDSVGTDTFTATTSLSLGSYAAIENLTLLGAAAINATGNALANVITGNAAANVLTGGAGNDSLGGGLGNDTLVGGAGNDIFRFNTAPNSATNRDTISDFANAVGNNDIFHLENAVFTRLAAGGLTAANFRLGAVAADANDYVIYNQANGVLSYDSNGNAAGGAVQIAVLSTRPALGVADFFVT